MRINKTIWHGVLIGLISLLFFGQAFAMQEDKLVIHRITSSANEDGESYTVELLVSILGRENEPVSDLTPQDIALFVDEEEVAVDQVEPVKDLPISVVVMLDKSLHMRGSRLTSARTSVLNLIKSLSQDDKVTVYAFNTEVETLLSLTEDLNQAQEDFWEAEILAGYSACVFDAALQAVQAANQLGSGRRAIVLISGGPNGGGATNACYEKSVDEALQAALLDDHYNPFYVIGLGEELESGSLKNLAEGTGGVFLEAEKEDGLDGLMNQVTNRLDSQYRITYTAAGIPGSHAIEVMFGDDSTSTEVTYPSLPPVLTFVSPEETEIEPEKQMVVVEAVERGIAFDNISLKIEDTQYDAPDQVMGSQYSFEVDFSEFSGQQVTLAATAWDENDEALREASFTLEVKIDEAVPEGTEEAADETAEDEPTTAGEECPEGMVCIGSLQLTTTQMILYGGLLLALVIGVGLLIFFMGKKKKGEPLDEEGPESLFEDATLDGFALPGLAMGRLTILSSDDPLMVGKEFQLTKSPTSIGRSVNNDIALPKDSAVSRKHIQILDRNDEVVLSEVMKTLSDGTKQPPTYGTYVNDRKVTEDVVLHNGDEISLGRRTKLRFEGSSAPEAEASSEEVTMDQIELPDMNSLDDATRDG